MEKHLLGDWNTDMLKKDSPVSKTFSKLCDTHGLTQLIDQPTRVSESSQTIIDLVVTSDQSKIASSGTIVCGLSDHHMIFCTRRKPKAKAGGLKTIQVRILKTYTSEEFNLRLTKVDWSPVQACRKVSDAWLGFKSRFLATLNDLAPLRTRVKVKSQAWMNPEILDCISLRNKKYCELNKSRKKLKKHFSVELKTRCEMLSKQAKKRTNQTTAVEAKF